MTLTFSVHATTLLSSRTHFGHASSFLLLMA
jgi:hypothetical protein